MITGKVRQRTSIKANKVSFGVTKLAAENSSKGRQSQLISHVSSITSRTSPLLTEQSLEGNAYKDAKGESRDAKEESTKATIDPSKSSIEVNRKGLGEKEFKDTALYRRLSKNGYEEARKVILRNTPLEVIRKQSILMLDHGTTDAKRKNSIKRRIFQNHEILNVQSEYENAKAKEQQEALQKNLDYV